MKIRNSLIFTYIIITYIIINVLIIHVANGKAGDILLNSDEKWLDSGKPWALFEDYTLTITIRDRERVFVSLSKHGEVVHSKGVYIENPYAYRDNKTGQTILSFYVKNINQNKIIITNIFQYSGGSLSPTPTMTTSLSSFILVATNKTLMKNEPWNIGKGWTLKVQNIDSKAKQVDLSIYENEILVNYTILKEGDVLKYNNIFITKIEYVFIRSNIDFVRFTDTYIDSKYVSIFTPDQTHTILNQIQTPVQTSTFNIPMPIRTAQPAPALRQLLNWNLVFIIFVIIAIMGILIKFSLYYKDRKRKRQILKQIEMKLNALDVEGFEDKVTKIKSNLKDLDRVTEVEIDFNKLERLIAKRQIVIRDIDELIKNEDKLNRNELKQKLNEIYQKLDQYKV